MPRSFAPVACLAALTLFATACSPACSSTAEAVSTSTADAETGPRTDRLLVVIVVDQFVPWQLTRLEPWLDGGLGRFLKRGQVWMDAKHPHGVTQTGPGHATIATGVAPARHGVVANSWRDRDAREWNCVTDPNVTLVASPFFANANGAKAEGRCASAWRLRVAGLSEHLRNAYPEAKTIGIAGKDRAAILGAGGADRSLWWDTNGRGFVSSSAFGTTLPGWVDEWNDGWWRRLPRDEGRVPWNAELPAGVREAGTAADERAGEDRFFGRTSFPHPSPAMDAALLADASSASENSSRPDGEPRPAPLPPRGERAALASWAKHSPWVDAFVLELAERAVREERLGSDDAPDLLMIGLSACDVVGHSFGPRSLEVTDLLLRTDRALGTFFDALDRELGPGAWSAALTSDHGVLELPEGLHASGVGSARLSSSDFESAAQAMDVVLAEEFAEDLVLHVDSSGMRLDDARIRDADLDPADVRARAREVYLDHAPFLRRAFTSDELTAEGARTSQDELLRTMAAAYYPGRSPDVVFVLQPYQIPWKTGTTHGSPWDYDRTVPLGFFGNGSPAERRLETCSTLDLLPTLFTRAGIPVPHGLEGRVLPPEARP